MENDNIRVRLVEVTRLSAQYCSSLENCLEEERIEFVDMMLDLLPRIYWQFFDISSHDLVSLGDGGYAADYVDEDQYEGVRKAVAALLGEEDTFLETFEEDMKYSDTPIAATVSESLADIYQPLFNFVSVVKDTEGESLTEAYMQCKEYFEEYWSQTLCNVLRALNNIKYNSRNGE